MQGPWRAIGISQRCVHEAKRWAEWLTSLVWATMPSGIRGTNNPDMHELVRHLFETQP